MDNKFGLTNDSSRLTAAKAWRDAAVADGWTIEATYESEDVERASSLRKEGFSAMIISRDNKGEVYEYEAMIYLWGPDRLIVQPPNIYPGFEAIKTLTKYCSYCNNFAEKTTRVSFAGRCCLACYPEVRKRLERPGWSD